MKKISPKVSDTIRAMVLVVLIVTAVAYSFVELMKIQIVGGDEYARLAQETKSSKQIVDAPRGEIVDVNGNSIVVNRVGFNVVIEKAFFPSDDDARNETILLTAEMLDDDNVEWIDNLPITTETPFKFDNDRDKDISKLREQINVQVYATAEECIDAMIEKYSIADKYSAKEKRIIAGIRYEMEIKDFSVSNRYIFAQDIPMHTVVRLKELSYELDGVDVVEGAIREYGQGDVIPHLIGTVGAINAEEYATLKDEGYALNDTLGKSGIEKALENELRGTDGERTLSFVNGAVSSDKITENPIPGHTVKLTVDSEYQRDVQQILENHIEWLNNQTSSQAKGMDANAGAIVVLDVKSSGILAAATNPTYNLNDYINNYSEVLNRDNSPLTNRATSGLYRPGSTFKTVTATAALNEGIIDLSTKVTCNGVYTYWDDYQPKCTGVHGSINVVTALEKSCNIFFYEVGRRMGINTLEEYAHMYGVGEPTGLETGGAVGYFASPSSFEQRHLEWQAGLVVQAAIGQSETYVTPLQMAEIAATIANSGVRYTPHIVDSIYTYNMEELVSTYQPEIAYVIEDKTGETFKDVTQGMIQAGQFVPYYYPSQMDYYTDYLLTDLPYPVAIKTGTPQMTSAEDTGSAFIGFYPAENPEIAFAGFVEHGEYSKLMIRQIIEAYYNKDYEVADITSQREKAVNSFEQNNVTTVAESIMTQTTSESLSQETTSAVTTAVETLPPDDDEENGAENVETIQ